MNDLATKINEDSDRLLYELHHLIATLGQISLSVDSIMRNSSTLANEGDTEILNCIFCMSEVLDEETSKYKNIKEDFSVDMVQLMEDIKQLMEKGD